MQPLSHLLSGSKLPLSCLSISKGMQLNPSWKIKMDELHYITGGEPAMNIRPCIHLYQYTPTIMRCHKMTRLTSSFSDHPRKSSMRSARPPQPQKEVFPSFIFSHGNYSSMFSLFCWMFILVGMMVVAWYLRCNEPRLPWTHSSLYLTDECQACR